MRFLGAVQPDLPHAIRRIRTVTTPAGAAMSTRSVSTHSIERSAIGVADCVRSAACRSITLIVARDDAVPPQRRSMPIAETGCRAWRGAWCVGAHASRRRVGSRTQ
jgi:hypothetical protein